ncbi:hypothetical protein F5X68DRAFT_48708 [Plectosphaerella plurivora]|uniref:2EXR domain-containing protein n=1 Tax=Plectosphaerella plurivora TaxID=936078 RepID=A0A9P9AF28_9PEZI|nr:hypothetical protein F5X68DRAFT_48708 [Plectosphaerella plurivora]
MPTQKIRRASEAPIMLGPFHQFMLLPPEIRQLVWELSMEPRRVPVGDFSYGPNNYMPAPPPAPLPAIPQACAESRTFLIRHYVKAFFTESPPRYTRINFNIDTVVLRKQTLLKFPADLPFIRHLSVEVNNTQHFIWKVNLSSVKLLQNLEVRPCNPADDDWFLEWSPVMERSYHRADPVPYRTTIISPIRGHYIPELNPENYLKLNRDRIRRIVVNNPSYWRYPPDWNSVPGPWDSDDEAEICRPGWKHLPDCRCTPVNRWAPVYF